jgi:hypothetical protein
MKENEQFKDKDCNLMDIEVRGERERKQCYFRLKTYQNYLKFLDYNRLFIIKIRCFKKIFIINILL